MKYTALLVLSVFISLVSCKRSAQEEMIANIKSLEQNKTYALSDSLINTYMKFVEKYPDHSLSPTFNFKAAEVCIAGDRILRGAKLYEQVAMNYSNDSLAPKALINGGVTYQSLYDAANAKRLFEIFMKNYPNHYRFEHVKLMHESAGLTEEELINRFKVRQQNLDSLSN